MFFQRLCKILCLSGLLGGLTTMAAELPPQGLLSIGRAASTPRIDGILDDAAWQECITLGPFMLVNDGGAAREQTTAQLCYDDDFLYLGVRAEAFCLQPETNELHAFQAKATVQDDDAIAQDDCLVFIISHGDRDKVMYDFFINANGAVLDARGRAPDFWGTRDRSWNADLRCQTKIEQGYWVLEAAIPLKALALSSDNLSPCRFLLGRLEKRSHETSAWQHLSRAFHVDDDWSQLYFRPAVPAIARIDLPEFRSSHNQCKMTLNRPWPTPLLWQLHRFPADGKAISVRQEIAAATPAQRWDLSVQLQDQQPFSYQTSLFDSNDNILLATPLYTVRPLFTDLVCLDPVDTLRVNGQDADARGVALKPGTNQVEVELPEGQTARFALGLHQFAIDESWAKEGKIYRKTLYLDQTVLWPNWKAQALHLCPGQGQQLLFWPNGLPDTDLKKGYKLTIEVPDGCEILGASGYYNLLPLEFNEINRVDGYRRYEITFPKVVRYTESTRHELHRWCAVYLLPGENWNGDGELRFYAATPDRKAEEIPQRVALRALPPVTGRQPNKIIFQLWTGWLRSMSDLTLREKILAVSFPAGSLRRASPALLA